jgi:predicted RNA binding protein YcfA (HicA-like mRNA interferase family)
LKRRDLLRHLEEHGCEFLREGANHTIYVNRATKKASSIPRHTEINNDLARKICKDLQVPQPDGRVENRRGDLRDGEWL